MLRLCRHELQISEIRLLRSTHSQGRSTPELVPRTSVFRIGDSRSTQHQSRSTLDPAPRTTVFRTGIAGRHNTKAGRHWISSQNSLFHDLGQCVDTTTRAGRHTTEKIPKFSHKNSNFSSKARSTPSYLVSTHFSVRSTLFSSCVDTILLPEPFKLCVSDKPCCSCEVLHHCKPLLGIRSTRRCSSSHFRQENLRFSPSIKTLSQSSLLSFINSRFHSIIATMVRKLGPRRGARSQASSRPVPTKDDAPQLERRTKRRNDPAQQPGSSSAPQPTPKRGRPSSSGRGRVSRTKILGSPSVDSSESSSSSLESSKSQDTTSEAKLILKPRIVDLSDIQLAETFPEIQTYFSFHSWLIFISEFQISYSRLVREFYKNLKCTEDGYKSKVKGIVIDMPTDTDASIFKVPDEGADYHEFEFDLHEAYSIMTDLPADASDPKQTHVVVEAPQAQEEQPQNQGDQPQVQEDQPLAEGDQPQGQEDQPLLNEEQPQVPTEGDIPVHAPLSPQFQPSFIHPESPQHTFQPSTSSGGPSVLPELFSFLNEKFETMNSSIQTMSETFELRIQRLENTVSAKFIEQKAASDYAAQRFNRLIGTMADASLQLKEHQQKLEIVQTLFTKEVSTHSTMVSTQ
ncbi:hypothetical protein Taro_008308 [Colocasia esculenta]|uniref:Uncharacterized protein n=1 Tax=Colocasia esculenta TaxID=4460 RepID=A0A843TXW5_COLES|nr:hypothetical protein [Colocasia esculenta]